ncbi:MAG: hypothetical protein ACYDG3_12100 [Bacillati bacterium]
MEEDYIRKISEYNKTRCNEAVELLDRIRLELEEIPYYTPSDITIVKMLMPLYSASLYSTEEIQNRLINVKATVEVALEDIQRVCRDV